MTLPPKVKTGDALLYPAEFFNAQIDATRWVDKQRRRIKTPVSESDDDLDIVMVRNDSEINLSQYQLCTIEDIVFTPEQNETEFKALNYALSVDAIPTWASPSKQTEVLKKTVVLLEPCAIGKFARAALSGIIPAKVIFPKSGYAGDPVPGDRKKTRFASPTRLNDGFNDAWLLGSAVSGSYEIVWADDIFQDHSGGPEDPATQATWCLVRQRASDKTFTYNARGGAVGWEWSDQGNRVKQFTSIQVDDEYPPSPRTIIPGPQVIRDEVYWDDREANFVVTNPGWYRVSYEFAFEVIKTEFAGHNILPLSPIFDIEMALIAINPTEIELFEFRQTVQFGAFWKNNNDITFFPGQVYITVARTELVKLRYSNTKLNVELTNLNGYNVNYENSLVDSIVQQNNEVSSISIQALTPPPEIERGFDAGYDSGYGY